MLCVLHAGRTLAARLHACTPALPCPPALRCPLHCPLRCTHPPLPLARAPTLSRCWCLAHGLQCATLAFGSAGRPIRFGDAHENAAKVGEARRWTWWWTWRWWMRWWLTSSPCLAGWLGGRHETRAAGQRRTCSGRRERAQYTHTGRTHAHTHKRTRTRTHAHTHTHTEHTANSTGHSTRTGQIHSPSSSTPIPNPARTPPHPTPGFPASSSQLPCGPPYYLILPMYHHLTSPLPLPFRCPQTARPVPSPSRLADMDMGPRTWVCVLHG